MVITVARIGSIIQTGVEKMSYYCVKCGKPIKESLPGNGLFCRDCSTDIILLTNDPRVISGYRDAAGKNVSGKRDSFFVEQRDQAVKPRNNGQGDENYRPASLSTGVQASAIPSATHKKNRSKGIIIAAHVVLVAELVATIISLFSLGMFSLGLIAIAATVVFLIIGRVVQNKNISKGIIIGAVCVLVPMEAITTALFFLSYDLIHYQIALVLAALVIFIIGIAAKKNG